MSLFTKFFTVSLLSVCINWCKVYPQSTALRARNCIFFRSVVSAVHNLVASCLPSFVLDQAVSSAVVDQQWIVHAESRDLRLWDTWALMHTFAILATSELSFGRKELFKILHFI